GWYSDPARDVMAAWTQDKTSAHPFAALLDRLGWRLTGSDAQPTRSLYEGTAFALPWDPAATKAPAPDPLQAIRDGGLLDGAAGTAAAAAFVARAAGRLPAAGYAASAIALLRTFLYDLLAVAAEPGGDARTLRAMEDAWFDAAPGGHRWAVVPRPTAPRQAPV